MSKYRFIPKAQIDRAIPEEHVSDNEWKGCTSKQTYYSEAQAASVALMVRATRGEHAVYEYGCKYCANWHVGHRRF